MSQSAIREYNAKQIIKNALPKYLDSAFNLETRSAFVSPDYPFKKTLSDNPWLKQEKLVVKPDQLFGKRGKHGLIGLNLNYKEAEAWIKAKTKKQVVINKASGDLTHFIIEPFVPHELEYYVAFQSEAEADIIYFSDLGGIEIEENWDKVIKIKVGVLDDINDIDIECKLPVKNNKLLASFITALFNFYKDYNFSYLEINPFAVQGNTIIPLDVVAKLDDTAAFESAHLWGNVEFPAPFGRNLTKEEEYIDLLDAKSGSSLKLTVLNPKGRIWTMVAGGGASVIYADTISDLGFGKEMANYGEYSGNPTTEETYEYAKTILDLMTRGDNKRKKALIIGGGIANFTDVAKTFTGIIQALKDYKKQLIENKVNIYVRRGGPNYQEGLRMIKSAGDEIGAPIEVYGPETHMTEVVKLAVSNL